MAAMVTVLLFLAKNRNSALFRNYDPQNDPELERVFNYALSQGVNLFDTADSYGTGALNGRSEQLLGEFSRRRTGAAADTSVHIATKLAGYPWRVTPWNMTAACRCSPHRLRDVDNPYICPYNPYRSFAKYCTSWVRIWWGKYLEIADRWWVFALRIGCANMRL
jgi:hypothetical protein